MRVHALVLARNEEANLVDCIASLRPLATDITVFDTGSRDHTTEVAHDQGVACVSVPWRDHFAEARNEALSHLRSDWIVVVDADERVSASCVAAVQSALRNADADCDALHMEVRTHTDDVERLGYTASGYQQTTRLTTSGYVSTPEPRLLRGDRGLHYEGRIGERLVNSTGVAVERVAVTHGRLDHLRDEESVDRRVRRRRLHLSLALREFLESRDRRAAAFLGAKLNEQHRWKAALTYLREAENAEEPGVGVHMQAGVARFTLGLTDGALASFQRAWELVPQHPVIATWLCRALLAQGDNLLLAEELLEEALAEAPELDLGVVLMAQVHRRTGRLAEARGWLQAILENNPVHPLALKELGAVALLQEAPRQAEQHLRQALRMRPRDVQVLNNLGCALERQGYWDEALSMFSQALAIGGNETHVIRNRCIAQAACGRLTQMCEDAETAVILSQNTEIELLTLRERLLDGGWIAALQHLESWSVEAGWSRPDSLHVEEDEETLEAI